MKLFLGLLVASVAFSGVFALPAGSPSDDAEVIDVPRRRITFGDDDSDIADTDTGFKDFKGVIDTGAGYPFLQPDPHPFSLNFGFFDSFEDIFRRLRTRLWPVQLSGGDDSSEEGTSLFDGKNGNTTSTVKIVDGHKIEVNETVYGDSNNVFKVRVVNIRPVDSDEDVSETSTNTDAQNLSPVTSAPAAKNENDESDERREPLDKKNVDDNEIRGNIDEPESTTEGVEQFTTMLPTTNEDNAAALIADNSLEGEAEYADGNGNIEAETNKSVNDNDDVEELTNHATLGEQQTSDEEAVSSFAQNERLTIENNEEAEVNDNLNESSEEAEVATTLPTAVASEQAEELTEYMRQLEVSTKEEEQAAAEDDDDDDDLRAELDQDDSSKEQAIRNVEFGAQEFDDDDNDDEDDSKSGRKHSNYAAISKPREDVSSSDDEDAAAVEMSPEFNSEWESLAEDLASTNDRDNDLNNDIDVYDAVPIDLSNDIAVNELAAARGEFNPDAEFVQVEGVVPQSAAMPKFEKLSMAMALEPTSYQAATQPENIK